MTKVVGITRSQYMADKCCVRCGKSNAETSLVLVPRDASVSLRTSNIFELAAHRREGLLALRKPVCSSPCMNDELVEQGRRKALQHGSSRMYQKGCRCVLCKGYVRVKSQRATAKKKKAKVTEDERGVQSDAG